MDIVLHSSQTNESYFKNLVDSLPKWKDVTMQGMGSMLHRCLSYAIKNYGHLLVAVSVPTDCVVGVREGIRGDLVARVFPGRLLNLPKDVKVRLDDVLGREDVKEPIKPNNYYFIGGFGHFQLPECMVVPIDGEPVMGDYKGGAKGVLETGETLWALVSQDQNRPDTHVRITRLSNLPMMLDFWHPKTNTRLKLDLPDTYDRW